MKKIERTIRLSQVVSNFGVGAVYDILGESIVLKDTKQWELGRYNAKGTEIKADRLINALRRSGLEVNQLFTPAISSGYHKSMKQTLPYMRFPRWLFCAKCRRMLKWKVTDEEDGRSPACKHCSNRPKLTPMRFIMICDHGHMSDIDWKLWAHSKLTKDEQKTCQSEELEFLTGTTKTGGLESVSVKCRSCSASRSLGSLTSPNILSTARIFCTGKQPWESGYNTPICKRPTYAVQRGAGNVYFPILKSAITIPPESIFNRNTQSKPIYDKIKNHPFTDLILESRTQEEFVKVIVAKLCENVGCKPEDVYRVIEEIENPEPSTLGVDIESEEWYALTTENVETDDRDKFVTKHYSLIPKAYSKKITLLIDKVVSVIKLREVRALTGFYRYNPGGIEERKNESKAVLPHLLSQDVKWFPAVEVYGEGIFISFNEDEMNAWEQNVQVVNRVRKIKDRVANSSYSNLLPEVTARFIMLHTLAHILIKRLAFECGYSSASLRERVYSKVSTKSDSRCGILIYTAAGDSEGTLGGLARQAKPSSLEMIFLAALQEATNCSADPICMESSGQGLDSLNFAACHACSLIAETSCTTFNLLLDRVLVIGDGQVPGFFEKVLNEILDVAINQE